MPASISMMISFHITRNCSGSIIDFGRMGFRYYLDKDINKGYICMAEELTLCVGLLGEKGNLRFDILLTISYAASDISWISQIAS